MSEKVYYQPIVGVAQQNALLRAVYNWMMSGLFVSGLVAYLASHSPVIQRILFGNPFMIWILLIGELGLVFAISGGVKSMSFSTASVLFIIFSVFNGLTLSSIFLIYTSQSIAEVFFVTALTFGTTSIYGYITKTDLTSWGNYLLMGLVGIIIASILNMFLHNSMLSWFVSYAGVFIFVGLTAYDTQKIRMLGERMGSGESKQFGKMAIVGALALYLDFVNLFLLFLRIFGRGKE